jgi:hypothetical protein
MKVIFLDVDGVLNDQMWLHLFMDSEIDEIRVARLAKIVKATGAVIVLSSSWRVLVDELDDTDMYIWDDFVNKLRKFDLEIYDRTPVIGMDRPLEIKTWLDQHKGQVEAFVSLDDDFWKEDYDKYGIGHCLVKTSFYGKERNLGGLQNRHVKEAINILNNK